MRHAYNGISNSRTKSQFALIIHAQCSSPNGHRRVRYLKDGLEATQKILETIWWHIPDGSNKRCQLSTVFWALR